MATIENSQAPVPPYVSFRTLFNFFAWLREVGIPAQIDRSFWGSRMSGITGGQVAGALKFLDLLTENLTPTKKLTAIVGATEEHSKTHFREYMGQAYSTLLADLSENASYKQFRDAFEKMNATGSTLRKSETFFLHAAKWCELPISPFILGKSRKSKERKNSTRKKVTTKKTEQVQITPTPLSVQVQFAAQKSEMIMAVIKRLPEPGSVFHEQEQWFDALRSVFNLEYKTGKLKSQ